VQDLLEQYPELQTFLNSKIGEARKQGRENGKADLLKSLGTEDANALKSIIEAEKARKEAEMTEVERLNEKIKTLESERDAAQQERQNYEDRTRKALIQTEIREQVRELNFNDVDDLVRLLDYTEVTVDLEESTVAGIKEQAKALAKSKPYLIKSTVQKPNPVQPTPQPATTQAREQAKKDKDKDKAWKPSL
jgi:cell division septation protein DedD